jgi:AcrR family transcriptional regulator
MAKSPNGGYKDKMRDDCVAILVRLIKSRRIPIDDLAKERGLSARSVYRWVRSFSFILPITVRSGVAIMGDEDISLQKLN